MTIRWAIIGCGDIARKRVAAAIQNDPTSQLVAACRRNQTELERFCGDFQVSKAYVDADELLADEEIDAVYIATPVNMHLPQTVAAAKAGKHVLCEKPMAASVLECDQMIDACAEHKVTLGIAYYRTFYALFRRIKELLDADAIGKPLAVNVVTSTALAMQPGEDGYWRVLPEGGGGALMDVGSHRLDAMLELFGDIIDVKAFCDTSAGDYPAEDVASLVVRFASGVQGTLQCIFRTPVDPDEMSILGTKGRLLASPLNGSRLIIDNGRELRQEELPPPANFNAPLIADFVAAIHERRAPKICGTRGRLVNRVMQLAYEDADMSD